MSLPSADTDLYFSVRLTTPEQPVESHDRLPCAVLIGAPVESRTATLTSVPAQTGMRCAVSLNEPGSTMLPKIEWVTFALLAALCPLPTVVILDTPHRSVQVGSGVGPGVTVGVGVAVGVGHVPENAMETPAWAASQLLP